MAIKMEADSIKYKLKEILNKYLVPGNRYIYGFADLRNLLPHEFTGYKSGISIGRKLDDSILDKVTDGPTEEYYNHYREINDKLYLLSENICSELREHNINCLSIKPSMQISGEEFKPYLDNLRYLVSHKMVATRAGLGWIGKTDLFISEEFGPRLRLSSILISPLIQPDAEPVTKSRCGNCNICVDACPADAANGTSWDINTDRDQFFDPWKCRQKCTELGMLLLKRDQAICGICVAACPHGFLKEQAYPSRFEK